MNPASLERKTEAGTMLHTSSKVLAFNSIGRLSGILTKVVLSNTLGVAGLGIYTVIMSFSNLFSVINQFGFHQSIVYYISKCRTENKWDEAYSYFRKGFSFILIISSVFLIAGFFLKGNLNNLFFNKDVNKLFIVYAIILAPLIAFRNYTSFSFRGMKLISREVIWNNLLFPLSILFFCWISLVLFKIKIDLNVILVTILIIAVIIVVTPFLNILKIFSRQTTGQRVKISNVKVIKFTLPMWLSSMFRVGIDQGDKLLLGIFTSTVQVGLYSASFGLAYLINFITVSFSPIFQPLISEAYTIKNFKKMGELYNNIITWTIYIVLLFSGLLLVFGDVIMVKVFGQDFKSAYLILVILVIGQAFSAIAGPAGNILLMTEKQGTSAKIMMIGVITALISYLILIPLLGATGAAIASALSIILINQLRVMAIKKYFNVRANFKKIFLIVPPIFIISIISFWLKKYIDYKLNITIYTVAIFLLYLTRKDFQILLKEIISRVKRN